MTPLTDQLRRALAFDTKEDADEILNDYTKNCSLIDQGNLFYAATQYQENHARLQPILTALIECVGALEKIDSQQNSAWCNSVTYPSSEQGFYLQEEMSNISETAKPALAALKSALDSGERGDNDR